MKTTINKLNALKQNKHKGAATSLFEIMLVLAIVVLVALASFFGYTIYMDQTRESNVESDFYSFSTAIQFALMENNSLAVKELSDVDDYVDLFNRYLDDELRLEKKDANGYVFSIKEDPWTMPYQVVFEANKGNTEFKMYIYSYGKNSLTSSAGTTLDEDDLLIVIELQEGQISTTKSGFDSENKGETSGVSITGIEAIDD